MKLSIDAHKEAGSVPIEDSSGEFSRKIVYNCGDIIHAYILKEAKIEKLSKHEIEDYRIKVFVDHAVTDGELTSAIDALGLRNYVVEIGFVDKTLGGKG